MIQARTQARTQSRTLLCRYFTYDSKHDPTEWGVTLGRWITQAKVWVIIKLLEWSGKDRQAKALANGFKALCVQNSFRYNRECMLPPQY